MGVRELLGVGKKTTHLIGDQSLNTSQIPSSEM